MFRYRYLVSSEVQPLCSSEIAKSQSLARLPTQCHIVIVQFFFPTSARADAVRCQ